MIAAQVIQFKVEQSILLQDEKSYVLQRLDLMMKQVKRASEIVDGLRSFSRGTWSETCGNDLVKVLGKVHDMMGQQFLGRGIEFRREAPESILLRSWDPHVIGAAIIQALAYARDHVEAVAAWHERQRVPYRKWVAVKCTVTDGAVRMEFSWDRGAMPAGEVQADLSPRKGFLVADAILTALGGGIHASNSSIVMTLGG
jgi:nitrogen fixation/metabolism regulation signal transduction histidine kinase